MVEISAKKQTFIALFMVTLSTLMYETLLTRIFSVTMWYHYAFVAISVALFGMTVGAILVYIFPNYFTEARLKYHLALSAWLFAITIVVSFLTHLSIPFVTDNNSIVAWYSLALTYVVIAVPFIFSGICVCLALTKFPRQVSQLYAADLAGAAFGCVLLIYVLSITDGPTAVIVVAFLASIGAIFFAIEANCKKLTQIVLISGLFLALFAFAHTLLVNNQTPLLRLLWVKGQLEPISIYEKWNSFSRIRVSGNPTKPEYPFGWGLNPVYVAGKEVRQLRLNIDASAGTVLTAFDKGLDDLEYLKYDITNAAHYLRPNADVFVIGVGGGRDILSSLVFKQKSVVGVEINEDIIKVVNQKFGDFTGHLDKHPGVTFINDEARSYIARSEDRFDIIQMSLIDTWAATAAGAFTLSENSLYTVEAWQIFLDHLTPKGILTVSRWYFSGLPGEMYRLTSLASTALIKSGVANPREHMVIIRYMAQGAGGVEMPEGVGTMLVSKEPFSERDLAIITEIVKQGQLELVLSPKFALDPAFETIASGQGADAFIANFPLNITPPTDDKPFFFHMLRLQDIFKQDLYEQGVASFNMKAVSALSVLLMTVVGLTLLCIIGPLLLTTRETSLIRALPHLLFFASIGFGFILVEVSQMQRLIVFLGHPTYSLSVVLFSLLLSSGLGSYLTQKISHTALGLKASHIAPLLLLLATLFIFGLLTPGLISLFQGSTTTVRILIAVGMLFLLGLFMGTAFPLGMKVASNNLTTLTPWFWGINGATSVCGSVLAVVIALSSSISTSFWIGFSCYVVAFIAFIWASRDRSR